MIVSSQTLCKVRGILAKHSAADRKNKIVLIKFERRQILHFVGIKLRVRPLNPQNPQKLDFVIISSFFHINTRRHFV